MTRLPLAVLVVLAFAVTMASATPAGDNIVINEIYCDGNGYYDGSEFIELYNPTDSAIDVWGWVLCGVEYDESCGGEDLWSFGDPNAAPFPVIIPPDGYLVVAKDGDDSSDPPNDDSFFWEFGFYPDFEQYDPTFAYDIDSGSVPDMFIITDDPATNYSDEIQLVGGRGYGIICSAPTSDSDVVYLYDSDPSSGPANLIDLVEYVDPAECGTDPCTGLFSDDGADDNAYPGVPFLGNTLGRDQSSTDTDMSINDWSFQAPTPGAQNIPNTPPWVRTLRYAPIPPMGDDDVIISAYATDDGTIDSCMVYYRPEGGVWGKVAATTSDSLYSGTIPSADLTDGNLVEYFIRAVDDLGAVMNYPAAGFSDPYEFRVGLTPIKQVQFETAGGDTSQLLGEAVNVHGIVTMATDVMEDDLFYIQDPDSIGPYTGVACYMPGTPTPVNEGDEVVFCGRVTEYYGLTEITRHFEGSMAVLSTGNSLLYTDVASADVDPLDVASEAYEGVLITCDDLTVTFESDFYGSWYARDASAVDLKVDDEAYYTYDAEVLDEIAELRGILFYDFGEYKVQPRYDEDIVGPPRVSDVRYTPIPPSTGSATTVSATLTDDVDITGATLYWSYTKARPYGNSVTMSESGTPDVWTGDIPAQSAGARVYYYVECTDGTMDATRPSAGGYSYYTGLETIQNVQQVPPGGDASLMDTLAVNVRGYVTAEPGVFNDSSFYIQDADGAWDGILVYDRNGMVDFERGDYVVCCGEVEEYYGMTQLALHFTDAAQLATPVGSMPDPVSVPTGLLQNVVSAEQYEGVYVHAEDCTVIDENVGIGEWLISNGAAADTCRVDDYADYDYVPQNGDNVYVRGVVSYSFGLYMLEPRGNEDIAVNPVGISDDVFGGKFGLAQNSPNPFNPKTTIAFNIVKATDVELGIYDVSGRKVATLIDRRMDAGPHQANWDGMTSDGERAASGVYFYKLTAGEEEVSRKMVLLK